MTSPKTHKVLLVDGTEARAVKLTARNFLTVLNWAPAGSEGRSRVAAKTGKESEKRIMLPVIGQKRLKAAYLDDWIVKSKEGFRVVKFDKVHHTLFFPNAYTTETVANLAYRNWVRQENF